MTLSCAQAMNFKFEVLPRPLMCNASGTRVVFSPSHPNALPGVVAHCIAVYEIHCLKSLHQMQQGGTALRYRGEMPGLQGCSCAGLRWAWEREWRHQPPLT